jgi:hypothetical protein
MLQQRKLRKNEMTTEEFIELQTRTLLRQKRKINLNEHEISIKTLMELNVSLPIILDWLEEKKILTTLPALRRFIKRTFGEKFYNDFVFRNGWQKTKQGKHQSTAYPTEKSVKLDRVTLPTKGGLTQEELKASLRQKVDLNRFKEE